VCAAGEQPESAIAAANTITGQPNHFCVDNSGSFRGEQKIPHARTH
jgi:hypothetical protein